MLKNKKLKLHKYIVFVGLLVLGISSNWLFVPQQVSATSSVRITEIMYDPSGNGSREFVEIYNGSDTTVNMGGWSMYGVDFVFPRGTLLAPNSYLAIARNQTVLQANNPVARIVGQYGGKLRGSGELVRVISAGGAVMSQVSYSYGGAWPSAPRNGGPSLNLIRTTANESLPACWGVSTNNGGTPSFANSWGGTSGAGCSNSAYPVTATQPPGQPDASSVSAPATAAKAAAEQKKQVEAKKQAVAKKKKEEQAKAAKKQAAEIRNEAEARQTAEVAESKRKRYFAASLALVLLIVGGGAVLYKKIAHTKKYRRLVTKNKPKEKHA